jgi:hypothetical protein
VSFQGVEVIGPVLPVPRDPLIHLGQTVRPKGVDAALRVGSHLHEPHLAEHAQMPRHGGLGQTWQYVDQFAGRAFTRSQRVEQRAPARVGDGFEDVHPTNIAQGLYRCKRI